LDTLFDEKIIYELAEVDLDKRDAFFSRLRAEFNKRMDAIERMPVLDKADAIAALPESVKAYFRMHGRVSNCDVRWYMNRDEVRLLVSVYHQLWLLAFPMRTVPLTRR
jgi:hypothetical protein